MTQEQTELLFKDLCGRLPYEVKVKIYNHWRDEYEYETLTLKNYQELIDTFCVEDIKPYLLPLSSMSEEQSKEYHELIGGMFGTSALINFEVLEDFFHKNHLDYRGLIPMRLANDATNLNIY